MNELRKEIAIQQKKGLPFIMTSVIIWLLILLVSILDINMNMKNLLVFCCSCPLLPLSWIIGKLIKVDIFSKENPLGQLGFIFTLNQMIYLLIVMWVFSAVPEKMIMVYAMCLEHICFHIHGCINQRDIQLLQFQFRLFP